MSAPIKTRKKAKVSRYEPCPCHSGQFYAKCCGIFHGGAKPPSALTLMRSRYAAYAMHLADYIIDTTDSSGPQYEADRGKWKDSIESFASSVYFDGLEILEESLVGPEEAYVAFKACLRDALGKECGFSERSRFFLKADKWLYHSGVPL